MKQSVQMNDVIESVTFAIKTFERPRCVERLVKSILAKYPLAKIMIADDSKVSCKEIIKKEYPHSRISVFELEYDCGLSRGRNYLVQRIETKYFVLLDDDFVFDEFTDIEAGILLLEENDLDIIGGYFRNYSTVQTLWGFAKSVLQEVLNRWYPINYIGSLKLDEDTRVLYADYIRHQFPDYQETDIVHNFFIAKTERIQSKCLWDEVLKLHEHTAFFLKAKMNGIRVGFTNRLSVKHKPIRMKAYSTFRNRNYIETFMSIYGIREIIATYDGEERIVTKKENYF